MDQLEEALRTGAPHHQILSNYNVRLLFEPECDHFRETRDIETGIALVLRSYAAGLGKDWQRKNPASNGLSNPGHERYLGLYTGPKNVERQNPHK